MVRSADTLVRLANASRKPGAELFFFLHPLASGTEVSRLLN
jgi:hypothetical protein